MIWCPVCNSSPVTGWQPDSGKDWAAGTGWCPLQGVRSPTRANCSCLCFFEQAISILKLNSVTSIIYQNLFRSSFSCRFKVFRTPEMAFVLLYLTVCWPQVRQSMSGEAGWRCEALQGPQTVFICSSNVYMLYFLTADRAAATTTRLN